MLEEGMLDAPAGLPHRGDRVPVMRAWAGALGCLERGGERLARMPAGRQGVRDAAVRGNRAGSLRELVRERYEPLRRVPRALLRPGRAIRGGTLRGRWHD